MKEKIKLFNPIQIISNILLIISVIGFLISKNDLMVSLYWVGVVLNVIGLTWFFATWTKGGVNADVHNSKRIFNELDNITLSFVVLYVLAFLIIIFIQNMNLEIRENVYLIVGFYIYTLIVEVISYIAEEKAYKETLKVIKKNKVGKNDTSDTKK